MKNIILALVFAASSVLSGAAFAQDVKPRFQSGALSFSGGRDFTNGRLLITGPNDFEAEETSSKGLPVFRVQGGRVKDGFYHFTASAATNEKVKIKKKVDNGRGEAARDYTLKPFHMSGMFMIKNGSIQAIPDGTAGADGDATE